MQGGNRLQNIHQLIQLRKSFQIHHFILYNHDFQNKYW
jgi:hypothetical protein